MISWASFCEFLIVLILHRINQNMKDKKDCWLKKVGGIQSFFDFVEFQSLISSTDFLSV